MNQTRSNHPNPCMPMWDRACPAWKAQLCRQELPKVDFHDQGIVGLSCSYHQKFHQSAHITIYNIYLETVHAKVQPYATVRNQWIRWILTTMAYLWNPQKMTHLPPPSVRPWASLTKNPLDSLPSLCTESLLQRVLLPQTLPDAWRYMGKPMRCAPKGRV